MPEQFFDDTPLEQLKLDPNNPRLPPDVEDRTQPGLLQTLARYNLLELARSITDKGFTPRHAEALLVVEEPENSREYVVVEGNRRLATLLLLTNDEKRFAAGVRGDEWNELAASAQARTDDLTKVPVLVYENREEVDGYLGFRHITGVTPWRPEPKARFISYLLRKDGATVDQVVHLIGSNHRTVRRYAEAYAVYQQAIALDLDATGIEGAFGVFYTALGWQGMRTYLGLKPSIEIKKIPENPVPQERTDRLRDLLGILFGDIERDLEAIIERGTRELEKLSDVLEDEEAAKTLLESRNLEHAWRQAGGGKGEILVAVREAHTYLITVNGQAFEYKDDPDVLGGVKRLLQLAGNIAKNYAVES